MNLDWIGIHEKICQLLVPIRQPPLIIGSEEERRKMQAHLQKSQVPLILLLLTLKRALIDLTKLEATKFVVHGNYEYAVPAAVQALRFSIDVYGPGKIELVPSHLLLAEAFLGDPSPRTLTPAGLGRYKQAEEYLSLANWSILRNPDCSNRLKSQLYRNFGKLYASHGKLDDALRQLANDVYFSSLQVGPEHVDTAGGYYYMATVFYMQKRMDNALAMADKVVEIWRKSLDRLDISHDSSSLSSTPPPPSFSGVSALQA
jgi:tetratricopeptide (TPR) repeat protein